VSIADRLAAVQRRVDEACRRAGRSSDSVGLVAVSKTHPPERLREAYDGGHRAFGESYAQELRDKAPSLPDDVQWHYIGRLQSNKAKYIAPHAHRIHALERRDHALALVKRAPAPLKCLVSVNVAGEASKGGVPASEALAAARALDSIDGIDIVGLMTLPPQVVDPAEAAPYFLALAELAERGRQQGLALDELSMGMSHDFEVAIAHGATWVRVGTAIFGPREA